MTRETRRGLALAATGAVALGFVLASTTGCAPDAQLIPPMVVAAPMQPAPADRLDPSVWCGSYVKVTDDEPVGCDAATVNGVRTRIDVRLTAADQRSADGPELTMVVALCNTMGGEPIVHMTLARIVAEMDCEDVDY